MARIIYLKCVSVALFNHGAQLMRHILSYVAGLALTYFCTLSYKRPDFRGENFIECKILVFGFLYNFA